MKEKKKKQQKNIALTEVFVDSAVALELCLL